MKKGLLLLISILLCTSFTSKTHKFYLSVSDIAYKKEKKELQIVTRVFANDFEDVLRKRYSKKIKLIKNAEEGKVKKSISTYLEEKFKIWADAKALKLEYLGKEYDNDQIILYLQAENVSAFSNIKIKDALLTDLFDDQKNMVHVEAKNTTKSLLLVKDKDEDVLNFQD